MKVRFAAVILMALLLSTGVALSAADQATVTSVEGGVTVSGRDLASGETIPEGAEVVLAEDARLSVRFSDGATMDVTGPAAFSIPELSDYARAVRVMYGRLNRFVAKDITTGIETDWDGYTAGVVRNGTIAVEVEESDERDRVVFKLFEGGENAKVADRGAVRPLTADDPIVVEREKMTAAPPPEEPKTIVEGPTKVIKLGVHTITITPEQGFTVEPTPGGGLLITCILPEGQFGQVAVDRETVFYLSKDESIEFDVDGNVVRHNAIVHVYAGLDRRGLYDEAVADPSDSSPIGRDD